MKFIYNDGGRSNYFKATNVKDCVTRAIANATGIDYLVIYKKINEMAKEESTKSHRGNKRSSSRNGVFKETWKSYLKELGWTYVPTMKFGSSERVHLTDEELPKGTLIVSISKHLTCVKDGVLYDTYDCSKKQYYDAYGDLCTNTRRCVYGYWRKD